LAETPRAEEVVRQNIEAIKRAYAEAGKGNMAEMEEIVHPEVVLRDRPESPDPRTYHGHAGLTQALESSDESFESFSLEPEEFIAEGDHVIVVLTMRGTGRGSGVPVEERIAHQWLVRDGKAVAMQVYSNPVDAIRDAQAAG
jgi:ketosteroid isomerase-like protein